MRKTILLGFLCVLAGPAHALDADMEARCREIDAAGDECLCSEPMITNGSWTSGFYNFPGSSTKQCGSERAGAPLYLTSRQVHAGFVVPSGPSAVPTNSGIPYVFHQYPEAVSSDVAKIDGVVAGQRRAMPLTQGKICHRFMVRYGTNWVSKDGTRCQADKLAEFNVAGISPQYQWVAYPGSFDLYYSGPHPGGGATDHLSPQTVTLADCQANWCGFEQCWQGNFATGKISPIARQYVVKPDGSLLKDDIMLWRDVPLTVPTPVKFDVDMIANLYKQATCGGERWLSYAVEAWFDTADDGTSRHGPWIGPPKEFTGGGGSTPVLGTPGQPTLQP